MEDSLTRQAQVFANRANVAEAKVAAVLALTDRLRLESMQGIQHRGDTVIEWVRQMCEMTA